MYPRDEKEMLKHSQDVNRAVEELNAKYGKETFQAYMRGYMEKIRTITNLNFELISIPPEQHQVQYSPKVEQVAEATKDYYEYLGSLPADMRRFFSLIISFTQEGEEEKDFLQEFFGTSTENPFAVYSIHSIRPQNYIMHMDAITNRLASLEVQNTLKVGQKGNKPILTTVTLDIPEHIKIEGGGELASYDKSIVNAVTSLLESGNTMFSIPMLYHAMTGKQNPTIDDALYDEISSKIERMRRMMLSIDLTEENEAHFLTGKQGEQLYISDVKLEGYILPLTKISGMVNGKKTELYQIIQEPPLYTYSKMRRQLASVRISLLGAPVNNNSTTIPLKTYLLQRIEMMKNTKNNIESCNILYSSIYKELDAQDAGKTKKMRIRTYTTAILDYFIHQRYISGYNEYKSGRTIAGINVVF